MGIIRQLELLACDGQALIDASQEIGAAARYFVGTACRIEPSRDCAEELVFCDEIPIRLLWEAKRERLIDGREVRWWRLEAKVDQTRVSRVQPRDHLVIAEHPYSIQRVHSALFKPASRKSREQRPSLARKCASAEDLMQKIESFNVDYWERGAFLTAGLSNPDTSMRPSDEIRQYQHSLFILGICADLHHSEQSLLATEQAQRLLRQTSDRTVRFWPKAANLASPPRLFDEVADRGPEVLFLSIRQALAGPQVSGWLGKPVMALADQIYRAHLNNMNRVVARRKV